MFRERSQQLLRTEAPITDEVVGRTVDNVRHVHALFGLITETGELVDAFKKHIFYGKPLDIVNVAEELGDLMWYVALLCDAAGVDLDEAIRLVLQKLRVRYPEKFTEQQAQTRNLDQERATLEILIAVPPGYASWQMVGRAIDDKEPDAVFDHLSDRMNQVASLLQIEIIIRTWEDFGINIDLAIASQS